jgi:hypothetical protein
MIPDEAKNQFQDIIAHEMFEMDRTFAGALVATQSRLSSQGLGQSSSSMQLLTKDATSYLKARGQFILGQLLRCLAAHHVILDQQTTPAPILRSGFVLRFHSGRCDGTMGTR